MTSPLKLLASLQSSGFTLRRDGDRILVSPASQLTKEQREAIKANKDALLALLDKEGEPEDPFGWLPPPWILWEHGGWAGARSKGSGTGDQSATPTPMEHVGTSY